ncbi:MAG: hypothetical protein U9Q67_02900 [Patescibacteria group bacterium]|nr:hypothetical protein [Patescibacteria group bacterium]
MINHAVINIVKSVVLNQMVILAQCGGGCGADQVCTAIGCISYDMGSAVNQFTGIAIGLGSVIAIGLVAYGGFTILTSTGEPEKLLNGREILTNALMGLALIVLAVFVLEFLGWDVLGIGNLGTGGIPFGSVGN